MAELFGLDIRALVGEAIEAAGGLPQGSLTKTEIGDNPNDPTVVAVPIVTTASFQGFVSTRNIRRGDTLIVDTASILTIISYSILPASFVPAVNDNAVLDGTTYELIRLIVNDPADAIYEFQVQ